MSSDGVFKAVDNRLDFPRDETRIRAFWKEHDVFHKTLSADTRHTGPSKGNFVFYEGPPTANGTPHNGHVLTRAIKDLFPRFKTMRGYDVPRKGGWDTHGLPVEVEVEKDLGIHGKEDIIAYGVEPFIDKCVESVFRYTEVWEENTDKIGYWIDLPNAYVTYHKSYVESVWWALSELHAKGLLYRGHKVVWWWPQGGTALSAGEVGGSYREVDDPSCYVAMELCEEPGTYLCMWTTTPWTLPSNGYAAIRGTYDYVKVKWGDRFLILAEALREGMAKKVGEDLEVVASFKGSELVGKRYKPCFETFSKTLFETTAELKDGGSEPIYWRVLDETFVTLDTGTGIVHVAPAFGEDDNKTHKKELTRYLDPDLVPLICAVAPNGHMTEEAGEFAGKYVKDADPLIIKDLKARGVLVHAEKYRHEYPFCWRASDDPLIQLARPAWYIRTTERADRAIANNQKVNWLPEHIKDGRFGNFLDNNVDWALSRERFWGTPLNVWLCDKCGAEHAPSSAAAIEAKNPDAFAHFHEAKKKDPSLNDHLIVHKPWIDSVTFGCDQCDGTMNRVPEVIDCWFDSGSMPFAQWGYPHVEGSKERFEAAWPADFISEAVDQTRGWFYSLLMISTLLFDKEPHPHPYKSCVVLGHICDSRGKKESKSKGNYTPPDIIIDRVRLEFAVQEGDDVCIAKDDYEGLDLTGQSSEVKLYRADKEDAAISVQLKPHKKLPRRIITLPKEMIASLGVEPYNEDTIKPAAVPGIDQKYRVVAEDPSRPAPGADAFRWFFYSASPPWTNTRHSLANVRLAQKDFTIKLRHVYSFLCIYANIDKWNPATTDGHRPAKDRALLDRWIASEVALTVRQVTDNLESLLVYDAAQRLIDLVDALSNWYVRRSRSRFWASAANPALAQDKADASFTLYEALVTICKTIAPFVPFFAEEMYQTLVRGPYPDAPISVHVSAFPEPDADVIDERLATEMRMVRELVSLGLQVRTDNKLRVRQPLSRADIVVASKALAEQLGAHAELIADELNVHEVRWLLPGQEGKEVSYQLKPNFRALGPRLGKKVQAVKKALAAADAGALRSELAQHGEVSIDAGGETITLNTEEVQVAVVASDGFAAAGGKSGVVVIHTELTEALLDEGLAREILARVQGQRKTLNLGYTDRINVAARGTERVKRVVETYRDHIAAEALCDEVTAEVGDGDAEMQNESIAITVTPA